MAANILAAAANIGGRVPWATLLREIGIVAAGVVADDLAEKAYDSLKATGEQLLLSSNEVVQPQTELVYNHIDKKDNHMLPPIIRSSSSSQLDLPTAHTVASLTYDSFDKSRILERAGEALGHQIIKAIDTGALVDFLKKNSFAEKVLNGLFSDRLATSLPSEVIIESVAEEASTLEHASSDEEQLVRACVLLEHLTTMIPGGLRTVLMLRKLAALDNNLVDSALRRLGAVAVSDRLDVQIQQRVSLIVSGHERLDATR